MVRKIYLLSDTKPLTYPKDVSIMVLNGSEAICAAVNRLHREDPDADIIIWNKRAGDIKWETVEAFQHSKDDVWHAGSRLSEVDDEVFLVYIHPYLNYRPTPDANLEGAANWKVTPDCALIRANALRATGGLPSNYEAREMAFADWGMKILRKGGMIRQVPALCNPQVKSMVHNPSVNDMYHFTVCHYGRRSGRYLFTRRILRGKNPVAEYKALTKSIREKTSRPFDQRAISRDLQEPVITTPRVSVILPTFGRYRYLAEVLADIQQQSVPVFQVIIGEGNARTAENELFYNDFKKLPLEVIWLDKEGTCYSRNQCLEKVKGEFVWIVDDDSRLNSDNLEKHLRLLQVYGADVSVGPAFTKDRPMLIPSQENVGFTFLDCGTTVCTTAIIKKSGGFDMQFNNYLANEDGEFGIRIVKAGGIILNNPFAKRFHYLAPIGGARTSKNNVHKWKRWTLRPRPVQSVFYTGLLHYSPRATWEATLRAWVLVGRRPRPGVRRNIIWELKYIFAEVIALPLSLYRLALSVSTAKRMFREGPRIPFFNFDKNE